jgi:hypothetical protein
MITHRPAIARNETTARAAGLPRRPRVAAAIASAVISSALFGGVVWGMAGEDDVATATAAQAATATLA